MLLIAFSSWLSFVFVNWHIKAVREAMKEIKAERVLPSYKLSVLLEMDLKSLKIKIWDIHLYFITTKY